MAGSKAKQFDQDVPVEFSTVSLGEHVARIGFKIDRENMNIEDADEVFAGKQLRGILNVEPKDIQGGQKQLNGLTGAHAEVEGIFDCKRFAISAKKITGGLSVPIESINVADLGRFVKRTGRLRVKVTGELNHDDGEGDEGGEE